MKILKNSLEIIEENTAKCPLCENHVNSAKLLKRINERLKTLESLKESNDNLNVCGSIILKIRLNYLIKI